MLKTKKCLKCEEHIPKNIIIDGKKRNLQKRKYCLKCSPFDKHNTKKIHIAKNDDDCDKKYDYRKYWLKRKKRVIDGVYEIVGTSCWNCEYDIGQKGISILDFHHFDSSLKCFGLDAGNIVGTEWVKVWKEIQKCVLLCCRCHRESHINVLDEKTLLDIYTKKWINIKNKMGSSFENFNINLPLSLVYKKKCIVCQNTFNTKDDKINHCSSRCASISRRKVRNRPSKEQLLKEIKETNYCAVSRKYGVSDNAVRKWLK